MPDRRALRLLYGASIRMARVCDRESDRLEARIGHAIEPGSRWHVHFDQVVLLSFVQILDAVRLVGQFVRDLEARHAKVAV
jgi:hypothetical protein